MKVDDFIKWVCFRYEQLGAPLKHAPLELEAVDWEFDWGAYVYVLPQPLAKMHSEDPITQLRRCSDGCTVELPVSFRTTYGE
eukprot:2153486-Lingulodinium_polyedra.AAC.1